MAATITPAQWSAVRTALKDTGDRFGELVLSVPADAMATRHWTVAEVAAHVGSVGWLYAHRLRPELAPLPVPALDDRLLSTTVDTIADVNELVLRHLTDRDPAALVARLSDDIGQVLDASAERDPAEPWPWLGDARLPLAGVLAHLLNELLLHGWDIGRARRVPWVIPPEHSALFFELFIVGMVRRGYGRLMDAERPPPARRIVVRFQSAYTEPVTFVLEGGVVTVGDPGERVDVRVTFEPPALSLMLFGRLSRARAALSGRVGIRGPRPWLLAPFMRVLRAPTRS
ncbi:maleylpyruvate isomerase family mycothiol-dependent enzyme [Micromonospora sp. CPCC 206060]|uniref:maleylpyruvate isomerase family mycothiol-dependent enzyme n=1 Tax=Micromonospora sp. CPCC 206060 TaxID=3122406 RepID=UPI002FF07904